MPRFKTEERAWSQQKKKKDISGLKDRGTYTSETRFWSDTPPCVSQCRQNMAGSLHPESLGRLPVTEKLASGGHVSYQGNQQRGLPLISPFDKLSWWGYSDLKISTVTK